MGLKAAHYQAAQDYDRQAEAYGWRGPDVAFGLSHEFVRPGDSVLDIGIGTGLGSAPFGKSGLPIYGMDNSAEMLEVVEQKGICSEATRPGVTTLVYVAFANVALRLQRIADPATASIPSSAPTAIANFAILTADSPLHVR